MTKNKRKCLLCSTPEQAAKNMNGWHICPDSNLTSEQKWGKKPPQRKKEKTKNH